MKKCVYLFELDSVRNSCSEEVTIGQNALFEEIQFKGNDLELFKLGAIKLSRFDKEGTPSQYMQNRIERCLAKTASKKSVFVFSVLPVLSIETELLIYMNNTLRYSDYTMLKD